ncbi:hypothetical protein [Nitrosomonas marina]|uniref:Uncharacterized protein n=1 Tax=Nitrosomonas marina TaxID=917 RepID=A0A1H8GDL1_9PROT|nr:hypothetical protein [Nitrosomonas marina]SEN41835.1 hypothetical protein SAMN05216325_11762 [Nitrosomonas marina]
MAGNDNKDRNRAVSPRTTSFAGKHPELAKDTPDSFREAPPNRREFDHARDRYISLQLKAMEKTEAQRRGESERSGRSSEMVKLSKPFPELRPANEQAPIRQAFNRAWLREQREARLAELEKQRQREQQNAVQEQAIEQSKKSMEREWGRKAQEEHVPQR